LTKIFKYEVRRLLWNKVFIGILVIGLCYGWMTLSRGIISGIAYTAPFSAWSFGYYLSGIVPLLCIAELFFLTFFVSSQERRVVVITSTTPVNRRRYAMARVGAVCLGSLIFIGCIILLGFLFCWFFFREVPGAGWLLSVLIILLPAMAFCLGVGWLAGSMNSGLIYAAMGLLLVLCMLSLPRALDFSLGRFFAEYPKSLPVLDPAFSVPVDVLLGRVAYLGAGIILFVIGQLKQDKRGRER